MNEKKLIAKLRAHDERAFNTLVLTHQGRIYSLCVRMLGQPAEAEDLAQEVFIRAFQAIGRFRGDSQLSTWLYRIAMNLCKNRLQYLARRGRGRTAALHDVHDGVLNQASEGHAPYGEAPARPDRAYEGQEAGVLLQRALAQLSPEFRELLILRDMEALSYVEIVEITQLAVGTVKSRLHRARQALRQAYLAEGGEL